MGQLLKDHIESNHLSKSEICQKAGIQTQYLSNIFKRNMFNLDLYEKLCKVSGLNPASVFDGYDDNPPAQISDITAKTVIGDSSVSIGLQNSVLKQLIAEKDRLIAEKERTIQILLKRQE